MSKKSNDKLFGALCLLFGLFFFAATAGTAIVSFAVPDRRQSESENRLLQQFPVFSLSSVADGSFMSALERYMTDQFPARDSLVSAKTYMDLFCGKKQMNGVYLGNDGYLLEEQTPVNEKQLDNITSSIRLFCQKNPDVKKTVAIAPNATYIMVDRLPYGVKQYDQKTVLDDVKSRIGSDQADWVDCVALLTSPSDVPLYYRTDHHWTTHAAYRVFERIAADWKLDTASQEYEFVTASDSFQGTLASSSGIRHIRDTLELCAPKSAEGSYIVEYESEHRITSTCFDSAKLRQRNQYEVFMGGNFDKVVITTTAPNDDTLLIVKDSYANCMIPMFTPYFYRIVVVDPRYLNDTLGGCMQDYKVTHMLFLYNLNTFLEDRSLADVLDYES